MGRLAVKIATVLLVCVNAIGIHALAAQALPAPAATISPNYGSRVAAAIRPNVRFKDAEKVAGNPGAEFDLRLNGDGTITALTLSKSSGIPIWDAAAQEAIRKTGRLPADDSGYMPSRLIVVLRPKG